jgi:3-hydroxyisobutyrate dehydrogenase-like beta-hydroxyacid dehydrogenase
MTEIIGFIGLGVLGSAIAKNFVSGGLNVIGYDVSAEACAQAQEIGVTLVQSPAQVSQQTSVVFTCLPNAKALRHVLHKDEHGLLKTDATEQRIIEMSTLSIDDKMSFAADCVEHGRMPVDCPVSGNRIMALDRKLTAFFSGDESDFHMLHNVLELTCSKTHYVGEFGNGIKVKLCGNILNLVHNSVAAEAMVLAMKSGLDPKMFHDVISGSGSSSAMFEVRGALMVDEDYQKEGMNLSVPLKDAKIISDYAAGLYCPIPIYQAALQNYYAAAAQGHADKDAAAVCHIMERAANVSRD